MGDHLIFFEMGVVFFSDGRLFLSCQKNRCFFFQQLESQDNVFADKMKAFL